MPWFDSYNSFHPEESLDVKEVSTSAPSTHDLIFEMDLSPVGGAQKDLPSEESEIEPTNQKGAEITPAEELITVQTDLKQPENLESQPEITPVEELITLQTDLKQPENLESQPEITPVEELITDQTDFKQSESQSVTNHKDLLSIEPDGKSSIHREAFQEITPAEEPSRSTLLENSDFEDLLNFDLDTKISYSVDKITDSEFEALLSEVPLKIRALDALQRTVA